MVIRIRLTAVIAVFFVLAFTVAVMSAAVYEPKESAAATADEVCPAPTERPTEATAEDRIEDPTEPEAVEAFEPRLTAPDDDNACYYSGDNIFYASGYGMPNCTCYAWGRAYELTGEKPDLSPCDACTWYDYNRENGCYDYGDTPQEGAIACWSYADGGSGHVAVVEEVEEDTLTFSNSAYSGAEFYTETAPVSDPSNGRDNWIFLGYIYL